MKGLEGDLRWSVMASPTHCRGVRLGDKTLPAKSQRWQTTCSAISPFSYRPRILTNLMDESGHVVFRRVQRRRVWSTFRSRDTFWKLFLLNIFFADGVFFFFKVGYIDQRMVGWLVHMRILRTAMPSIWLTDTFDTQDSQDAVSYLPINIRTIIKVRQWKPRSIPEPRATDRTFDLKYLSWYLINILFFHFP